MLHCANKCSISLLRFENMVDREVKFLISDFGPQQLHNVNVSQKACWLKSQPWMYRHQRAATLFIHGRHCYSKTHYASCQEKVSTMTQSSKLPRGIQYGSPSATCRAQFQLSSGWRRQKCITSQDNMLYCIAYMPAHAASRQ